MTQTLDAHELHLAIPDVIALADGFESAHTAIAQSATKLESLRASRRPPWRDRTKPRVSPPATPIPDWLLAHGSAAP